MSQPGVESQKNKGYMLTAFCDTLLVIAASWEPLAGLLSETPSFGQGVSLEGAG
jgi:hypothetical protein